MDVNKNIVKKSWNQGLVGRKAHPPSRVSLGSFRAARNLGPMNASDTTTTGNKKFVSDSSDYTRFRTQYAAHKTWKNEKGVRVIQSSEFDIITTTVGAEGSSMTVGANVTAKYLGEDGFVQIKRGSSTDTQLNSGTNVTGITDESGEVVLSNMKVPKNSLIKIEVEGGEPSTLAKHGGDFEIDEDTGDTYEDDTTKQTYIRLIASTDLKKEPVSVVNNVTDMAGVYAESYVLAGDDGKVSSKTIPTTKSTKDFIKDDIEKPICDTLGIEDRSAINKSIRLDPDSTQELLSKSKELKGALELTMGLDPDLDISGNSKATVDIVANRVKRGFADIVNEYKADESGTAKVFKFTADNDNELDRTVDEVLANTDLGKFMGRVLERRLELTLVEASDEDKESLKERVQCVNTLLKYNNGDDGIKDLNTEIYEGDDDSVKREARREQFEDFSSLIMEAKGKIKKARKQNKSDGGDGKSIKSTAEDGTSIIDLTNKTGLINFDDSDLGIKKLRSKKLTDDTKY